MSSPRILSAPPPPKKKLVGNLELFGVFESELTPELDIGGLVWRLMPYTLMSLSRLNSNNERHGSKG